MKEILIKPNQYFYFKKGETQINQPQQNLVQEHFAALAPVTFDWFAAAFVHSSLQCFAVLWASRVSATRSWTSCIPHEAQWKSFVLLRAFPASHRLCQDGQLCTHDDIALWRSPRRRGRRAKVDSNRSPRWPPEQDETKRDSRVNADLWLCLMDFLNSYHNSLSYFK